MNLIEFQDLDLQWRRLCQCGGQDEHTAQRFQRTRAENPTPIIKWLVSLCHARKAEKLIFRDLIAGHIAQAGDALGSGLCYITVASDDEVLWSMYA